MIGCTSGIDRGGEGKLNRSTTRICGICPGTCPRLQQNFVDTINLIGDVINTGQEP